jgi:cellulose synthase/poly-beta-1,6-N-acetylglucosamine synthase-like glycosyltransferase
MTKIPVTIGITAYNEEANIGRLLQRILEQELDIVQLTEILVVASGCTDRTEEIVLEQTKIDPRIRLLVQEKREGKASAFNLIFRQPTESVVMLCSADLLPQKDAVENLVAPFADPEMGLTASHPVPVNDPNTFMGFATHMLWELHHQMNLEGGFKAGEMIAMRKIFERIPYHTAVDEASIEPVIRAQGYIVQYAPDAIVQNKGPETVEDFLRQRRRIYAGHLDIQQILGYAVSTMSGFKVLKLLLRHLDWRPKQFVWTWAVVALEVYGRILGSRDHKNKHDHSVWEIATTTKELVN